jgi:hypothetical protein
MVVLRIYAHVSNNSARELQIIHNANKSRFVIGTTATPDIFAIIVTRPGRVSPFIDRRGLNGNDIFE